METNGKLNARRCCCCSLLVLCPLALPLHLKALYDRVALRGFVGSARVATNTNLGIRQIALLMPYTSYCRNPSTLFTAQLAPGVSLWGLSEMVVHRQLSAEVQLRDGLSCNVTSNNSRKGYRALFTYFTIGVGSRV